MALSIVFCAACDSTSVMFQPEQDAAPEPDVIVGPDVVDDLVSSDRVMPGDVSVRDVSQPLDRPDVQRVDVQRADVPIDLPPLPMGMTLDYVITRFSIDADKVRSAPNTATHTTGVAGFNLDGRFTGPIARMPGDCAHGDFFSTLDADQNMGVCTDGVARGGASCTGGVDNQLPELADLSMGFGADLRASINGLVATGRTAFILRIVGVDEPPSVTLNDSDVVVLVYPVGRPLFSNCALIGTPGQAYAVDDASLLRPGDLTTARYRFAARIERGRLMTTPIPVGTSPDFSFDVPLFDGASLTLSMYRTQMRASLSVDRADFGNLGGFTRFNDALDALVPLLPSAIPTSTVRVVLQSLIDVQLPEGAADGCMGPNGAVSLGMGFAATRANLSATSVRGAQSGMCGSF
jgi:hypothetical protein